MLGRLCDDVAAGVEAGASGTACQLLEFADAEFAHLPAVELRQPCQQYGADGNVDADAERIGAGDDQQQPLECELFDQPAVFGQHACVVDADAVQEELAQALPESLREGEALDGCRDRSFLLLRCEIDG